MEAATSNASASRPPSRCSPRSCSSAYSEGIAGWLFWGEHKSGAVLALSIAAFRRGLLVGFLPTVWPATRPRPHRAHPRQLEEPPLDSTSRHSGPDLFEFRHSHNYFAAIDAASRKELDSGSRRRRTRWIPSTYWQRRSCPVREWSRPWDRRVGGTQCNSGVSQHSSG